MYSLTHNECQHAIFHIFEYNSQTVWSMTLMNTSHESLFLAIQVGALPVMSLCIITKIQPHKESHYQKPF